MSNVKPPTALVSWAHRNVGWSNPQAESWTASVVRFSQLLRTQGVDADLDVWHESDTSIDWTRWGQLSLERADFVLIVISTAWKQRWQGTNAPNQGAGAVAEADTLKGIFNRDQQGFQAKTILIMLPGVSASDIPSDLFRLNRVHVRQVTSEGIDEVLRYIFAVPRFRKPPLQQSPSYLMPDPYLYSEVDSTTFQATIADNEAILTDQQRHAREYGHRDGTGLDEQNRKAALKRGILRGLDVPVPSAATDSPSLTSISLREGRSHSAEQEDLLAHSPTCHGVVLAGPGTGKSTTVLELSSRLANQNPPIRVRVTTFTRAATRELLTKSQLEGHLLREPSTLHSFALSILMSNPTQTLVPQPLRIPSDWETKELIHPDISRRLKSQGYAHATPTVVDKLFRELATQWESLNPQAVLITQIDPTLRNSFRAAWNVHRAVFGYTSFAEMANAATTLLEDQPDADLGGLNLLVVDEYQDLNKAEIAMVAEVARHGISVLAVGDDDQSIYGFRHAAPEGIRKFTLNGQFPGARTYTLSTSYRCGSDILDAARELIEASPNRPHKPPLRPRHNAPKGEIAYLRFPTHEAEAAGMAQLAFDLVAREGVDPEDLVFLVRSDFNSAWSRPLKERLIALKLPVVDVEAFRSPILGKEATRLFSTARLMLDDDDLAWWSQLKLTHGIGDDYIAHLVDESLARSWRLHQRLLCLREVPPSDSKKAASKPHKLAVDVVDQVLQLREVAATLPVPYEGSSSGWGNWICELGDKARISVSEELRARLTAAEARVDVNRGLRHFIDSLDEVVQDLALEVPSIAIMSMTKSKGLTRSSVFVLGVEAGIVPPVRPETDDEEERRLLYVAMTRPRNHLFLSMASRRSGPTARTGGGTPGSARSRSKYFVGSSLQAMDGARYIAERRR